MENARGYHMVLGGSAVFACAVWEEGKGKF